MNAVHRKFVVLAGAALALAAAWTIAAAPAGHAGEPEKGTETLVGKSVMVLFASSPVGFGAVADVSGVVASVHEQGFWLKATNRTLSTESRFREEEYRFELFVPWTSALYLKAK